MPDAASHFQHSRSLAKGHFGTDGRSADLTPALPPSRVLPARRTFTAGGHTAGSAGAPRRQPAALRRDQSPHGRMAVRYHTRKKAHVTSYSEAL